jgi:DNA-binding transcriptional LysR family regulator
VVDLNKVALFCKVVEEGSFSGAARSLSMPKASVSRQVAQLEASLGTRLLHRTTRQLQLTAIGQDYLQDAKGGLAQLESASQRLLEVRANPSGVIRVAAPREFGNRSLTDWIVEFLKKFEQVRLELVLTDEPINFLSERVDVAFQAGRPVQANLVARRLWTARKILLASPDYLKRRGEPHRIRDLRAHDFVIQGRSLKAEAWRLSASNSISTVRPEGRFSVDSAQAALRAAVSGLGIILLPAALAADDVATGRLRRVLKPYEAESRAVYVVYQNRRNLTAAVRAFIEFVVAAVPQLSTRAIDQNLAAYCTGSSEKR